VGEKQGMDKPVLGEEEKWHESSRSKKKSQHGPSQSAKLSLKKRRKPERHGKGGAVGMTKRGSPRWRWRRGWGEKNIGFKVKMDQKKNETMAIQNVWSGGGVE